MKTVIRDEIQRFEQRILENFCCMLIANGFGIAVLTVTALQLLN